MAAQQHMRTRLDHGHMWDERTVTQLFLAEAHERSGIRYAEFTQRQEAELGADWIWWFIDRSGESFGMLTQAKSLKSSRSGRYRIDFGYGNSRQITVLRDTADLLSIPAAYVLYCGDSAYRNHLACNWRCTRPQPCKECDEKSVSVLPALMAHHTLGWDNNRADEIAFELAEPIERIGGSEREASRGRNSWGVTDPRLRTFLDRPQIGSRAIAKTILLQVRAMRMGQASAASSELIDAGSDAVFTEYPDDRGHFSVPYTPHVLRGLRSVIPNYVAEFIRYGTIPRDVREVSDGIVVIFV